MDVELTGIDGLDKVTNGLPSHALTQLLGRPGTGKTVMALQIAMHAIAEGRDVLFLSVFSEPNEKLIAHMRNFSFFRPELIGREFELVSLKTVMAGGTADVMPTILRTARTRRRPLIILDGFRGLRMSLGADDAQELLAGLSSQLPYYDASCIVCFESGADDSEKYQELASADAIVALSMMRHGPAAHRRLEVLKIRGHAYREGAHGLRITGDGIAVFPRLASMLPDESGGGGGKRFGFGIQEFDKMLGGGLPERSLTVIFGEPGTGKTTLGVHFLVAGAAEGNRGLLLTCRETAASLVRKSRDLELNLQPAIEDGTITVWRIPPVEMDPDEFAWELRRRIQDLSIDRLVIDGLTDLERAAKMLGPESDYLASIGEYLRRSGTTTVLLRDGVPAQLTTGSLDDATMPIAQNRIILRRIEYRRNLYRICSILNMEGSKHDTSIREFNIGLGGLNILPASESDPGILTGIPRERSHHGA